MIFSFDIDGVICSSKNLDYSKSKPIKKNILIINKLYDNGHEINIFTARYMGRNENVYKKAKKEGFKSTEKQLKSWGLKYHKLFFGKPASDIYIDDKSLYFKKNWSRDLSKYLI